MCGGKAGRMRAHAARATFFGPNWRAATAPGASHPPLHTSLTHSLSNSTCTAVAVAVGQPNLVAASATATALAALSPAAVTACLADAGAPGWTVVAVLPAGECWEWASGK